MPRIDLLFFEIDNVLLRTEDLAREPSLVPGMLVLLKSLDAQYSLGAVSSKAGSLRALLEASTENPVSWRFTAGTQRLPRPPVDSLLKFISKEDLSPDRVVYVTSPRPDIDELTLASLKVIIYDPNGPVADSPDATLVVRARTPEAIREAIWRLAS